MERYKLFWKRQFSIDDFTDVTSSEPNFYLAHCLPFPRKPNNTWAPSSPLAPFPPPPPPPPTAARRLPKWLTSMEHSWNTLGPSKYLMFSASTNPPASSARPTAFSTGSSFKHWAPTGSWNRTSSTSCCLRLSSNIASRWQIWWSWPSALAPPSPLRNRRLRQKAVEEEGGGEERLLRFRRL